jgi:geranylgeranyl diphosphate synthase, type I
MALVASDTFEWARELVTPTLQAMVDRLDASTRLVVSYHFGWCDEQGNPANAYGGKAIRPALALLGAKACDADPDTALPVAAAVELIHNFSLVHDDLMDRDYQRRHRPTVWALWGDAVAVLAGDAMLSLAHEVLVECKSACSRAAQTTVAVACRALIRGQVADIAFEKRDTVSLAESLSMARGKTAALIAASATAGAQLAGGSSPVRDALGVYGGRLGVAFQLVDDLLGIWGDPAVTGKPVFSDLRARKKTLPIAWTLEYGGCDGRDLAGWLADSTHSAIAAEDELSDVAGLLERAGARAWAREEAQRYAALAIEALEHVGIPQGPALELQALANYFVDRQA